MKNSENLQNLLPFGYLYLVIMGILKESVFYHQIGINILEYSTIMDILVSPISTLTSNPIVFLAVLIFIFFLYAFIKFLSRNRQKKWALKLSSPKNHETLNEKEIALHYTNLFITVTALGLLSFFLGIGLGSGSGLSRKIEDNKLKYHQKLNFNTGETEPVYLINTNSSYYFYLTKGNKNVKIAPIGSVRNIELINQ